jgi:hypothetical protein
MNRLFVFVVLVVAGAAGLGYYMGWYRFDSDKADGQTHITLTVDQKKIQEDEKKALERVRGKE